MSRLIARNPLKALEVGRVLLNYIKANPGGLHYAKHFPNDGWGERRQLKHQRDCYSIEVFSDIAYAAGANHRSVQGIAVFFAGSPVAWQSSQQPFATHSTAESELVSYCESLLIGRATESLLCAMWGHPLNRNPFTRTIYGDNLAAIGLASGNTCASWRTRHLRIRASILKEAMEEECEVPGGIWRLLHLKGSELVADGLTKQLLGQAFARFVMDLGLRREVAMSSSSAVAGEDRPEESQNSSTSGVGPSSSGAPGDFAAVKAIVLGSTLLSVAEASQGAQPEEDFTPVWVAGATLMALGAVVGQIVSRCCLKRLHVDNSGRHGTSSEDEVLVVSEDELHAPVQGRGSSSCTSAPVQGRGSSSCTSAPVQGRGSSSCTSAPVQGRGSSSCTSAPEQGRGSSSRTSAPEQGCSLASRTSSTSQNIRRRSGLAAAGGEAKRDSAAAMVSEARALAADAASSASSAAAAAERALSLAAVVSASSEARVVSSGKDPAGGAEIKNPWNLFQHENRNKGWTPQKMAEMYQRQKNPEMP